MYKLFVGVLLLATAVAAVQAPKNKEKDLSELTITMQYDGLLGVQDVKRDLILGAIPRGELSGIVLDDNRKVVNVQKDASVQDIKGFSPGQAHLIYITWPSSQPPCFTFVMATRDGKWTRRFQYFPIGGDEPPFLYAAFLDHQDQFSRRYHELQTYTLTIYKDFNKKEWSGDVRLTELQRDHLDKITMKRQMGMLSVASMTFSPVIETEGELSFTWDKPWEPKMIGLSRPGWTAHYAIRTSERHDKSLDKGLGTFSADVQSNQPLNDNRPPPYSTLYPDDVARASGSRGTSPKSASRHK